MREGGDDVGCKSQSNNLLWLSFIQQFQLRKEEEGKTKQKNERREKAAAKGRGQMEIKVRPGFPFLVLSTSLRPFPRNS